MYAPTAQKTVLWIEDDPHAPALANIFKKRGYKVDIAPRVADAIPLIERMRERQIYHNILLLDMNVELGPWPPQLPLRVDGIRQAYPSLNIIDLYREKYNVEPLVGALTGESPKFSRNVLLEQELLDTGIRFMIEKAERGASMYAVSRMFDRLLTPAEEQIGMNIIIGGAYASGKTNLTRYLTHLHRVAPLSGEQHVTGSPMLFYKLSSHPNAYRNEVTLKDAHNESVYVKGLSSIRNPLQELDREGHVVHYTSNDYDYAYVVTREGKSRIMRILTDMTINHHSRQIISMEEMKDIGLDFITSTANVAAGHRLLEYSKRIGCRTLSAYMHIDDTRLMQQFAKREHFSPTTLQKLTSAEFYHSSQEARKNMLLRLEQEDWERPVALEGKLTDIGIKATNLFQLNAQWKANCRDWFRYDVSSYFSEANRLEDRIMELRKEAASEEPWA